MKDIECFHDRVLDQCRESLGFISICLKRHRKIRLKTEAESVESNLERERDRSLCLLD